MSLALATRGYHGSGSGNAGPEVSEPTGVISNNKDPAGIILDIIQDQYYAYRDLVEPVAFWQAQIPRLPNDPIPAFYSFYGTTHVEQRNIPEYNTTLERNVIQLSYYTHNKDILWNVQQIIKQILVSDIKVQTTSQYINTGIQWIKLVDFQFDYIFNSEEKLIINMVATLEVVFQENYQ